MTNTPKLPPPSLALILLCLLLVLVACGRNPEAQSGGYSPHLIFPEDDLESDYTIKKATGFDCEKHGVATITVNFSVNGGQYSSQPFDCKAHKAGIAGVPPGSGILVQVFAKDTDDNTLYTGQEENVKITKDQVTQGGEILMQRADGAVDLDGDGYFSDMDWDDTNPDIGGDGDGDGSPIGLGFDCDDTNSGINPEATDIPGNKVDENCDGIDIDPSGNSFTIVELDMEFVRIPEGYFDMGSLPADEDPEAYDRERPRHRVTFNQAFYMQTTEVTQRQYETIMGVHEFGFPHCGEACPAENVSWDEAKAFIEALNARYGNKYGFALPTEAQWEYAARAGSITAYAFGDSLAEDQANFRGRNVPMPVKSFAPNGWGLYDMHGNVWEWVEDDFHETYVGAPIYGSAWIDDPRGDRRVMRGGSWNYYPRDCRSAYRHWGTLLARFNDDGFRLAAPVFSR